MKSLKDVISLKNKLDNTMTLKIMFYIYLIFFYSQIAFLGKSLLHIEKIGEAVYILQNTNLFLVRALRVFISNKKAWHYALMPLLKEVSIVYLMMSYLWISLKDHKIFKMWSYTILFPLVLSVVVLFAINQNSVAIGFMIAQYLGYFILGFALIMMLVALKYFFDTTSNLRK